MQVWNRFPDFKAGHPSDTIINNKSEPGSPGTDPCVCTLANDAGSETLYLSLPCDHKSILWFID